ncbi:t-SNARE coiled-coil homology domain-containing protein [Durusdinium trenchii]|uniref:t-SNARE coiled-coil homology domain-containing protein n=1 Tax=Durusdinium trenchii TaxID=1381693 RepID=A0ABP0LA65_9DINO
MASGIAVPLLCDFGRSGQLIEAGVDLGRQVDSVSKAVQTEPRKGKALGGESPWREKRKADEAERCEAPISGGTASNARLLQLAVGLLGLEIHEKPNTWAEVWLRFQEPKLAETSSQPAKTGNLFDDEKGRRHSEGTPAEWQQQVLSHLKELQKLQNSKLVTKDEEHQLWENLDLAEHALKRIAHAVNLLQDGRVWSGDRA